MKKFLSNDYLTMLCRITFGIIFIYASLDKIAAPDQFARVVYNYHLVPGSLINLFALILPMSELIAGIFLIFGVLYKGARNYLVLLMLIFIIAISINVLRGVNLECGCFSVSSKAKSHGLGLIGRDILMLLPGLVLLFSRSRKWMLQKIVD
ncbi:MAG: MauE/DoxX family redox-associated membrane protein [Candidatus Zixiibacteriota bacterium]